MSDDDDNEIDEIMHSAAQDSLDAIATALEREGLVSKRTGFSIRHDYWYNDEIYQTVKEILNEYGDEDTKNPPANPEPTYR